jgi:hypothetical protein
MHPGNLLLILSKRPPLSRGCPAGSRDTDATAMVRPTAGIRRQKFRGMTPSATARLRSYV